MTPSRVWFVTGASMGLGKSAAEEILSHDEVVVAAVRTPSSMDDFTHKHPAEKLLVVRCDVTNQSDIKSAFNLAYEQFGRVDVVFNNAGICHFAEAEAEQDELARKAFEVNFWGAVNVMKEAVQGFRERNPPGEGGRILNNISAAGLVAAPLSSYYTASKHALEGFAQTLAKELDPAWNIKITNIEPGVFKTGAQESRIPKLPPHPAYSNLNLPSTQLRQVFGKNPAIRIPFGDPRKAMQKVYEVSKLDEPPMWLPLGKDSVELISAQVDSLDKIVRQFAGWSDDLQLDKY